MRVVSFENVEKNLQAPQNPALVKGMQNVSSKIILQNLQSTKKDWDSLEVPKSI
jgi:hypothetical protein